MKIPQVCRALAFPVPKYLDLCRINDACQRLFELAVWPQVVYFDWLDNPAYQRLRDELAELAERFR